MGLGSFFRRLLGGEERPLEGEPVTYGEYTITPTPMRQGSAYLTAGIIRKHTAEGVREHRFIRADTHHSPEDAANFAILKGRQIVDQLGDRMFEQES